MRLALVALALIVVLAPPVRADFKAGVLAYDAGDYEGAYQAWLPLARGGDPAAQRNLGHLFRFGRGVEQSFATAAEWYERAANAGLAGAQVNLAMMQLRAQGAQGVTRDPATAAYWLEQAALQGHVLAQYNLARLYLRGDGVPLDRVRGVAWLKIAAKGGHRGARERIRRLRAASSSSPDDEAARTESETDEASVPVSARALGAEKAARDGKPARALPAPGRAHGEATLGDEGKRTENGAAAREAKRLGEEVARLETPAPEDLVGAARRRERKRLAEAILIFNTGDLAGARRILEPLALDGVVDAQYRLGHMHAESTGDDNRAEAYVWLALAAENGHPEARRAQWDVLDAMGEAERRHARSLLRDRRSRLRH